MWKERDGAAVFCRESPKGRTVCDVLTLLFLLSLILSDYLKIRQHGFLLRLRDAICRHPYHHLELRRRLSMVREPFWSHSELLAIEDQA